MLKYKHKSHPEKIYCLFWPVENVKLNENFHGFKLPELNQGLVLVKAKPSSSFSHPSFIFSFSFLLFIELLFLKNFLKAGMQVISMKIFKDKNKLVLERFLANRLNRFKFQSTVAKHKKSKI